MNISKLLAIIFSTIIVLTGCSKMKDNSAMFRGGLKRTGVYHTQSVEYLSALKWKFKTEDGVVSSPAVADGIVYFGSFDHYLYAVE